MKTGLKVAKMKIRKQLSGDIGLKVEEFGRKVVKLD